MTRKSKLLILGLLGIFMIGVTSFGYIDANAPDSGGNASGVIRGPAIQNLGPTSATIMWETDHFTSGCVKIDGRTVPEDGIRLIHEVRINGLQPRTSYRYQIDTGAGGEFTTLPLPGYSGTIKAAVIGDTQGGIPPTVVKLLKGEDPDFIIHLGDVVERGSVDSLWGKEFFGPMAEILRNKCVFPVVGNHSDAWFSPNFYRFFSLPNNERWYSVTAGSAHFIFLDSNWWTLYGHNKEQQVRWLKNDLRHDNSPWKIAIFHHPLVTIQKGYPVFHQRVRKNFLSVFYRYGVPLFFNGHDHNYSRSKRIYNEAGQAIAQVISGSAGRSPSRVKRQIYTETAVGKCHHICILEITPAEIRVRAISADGAVLDEFKLGPEDRNNPTISGISLHLLRKLTDQAGIMSKLKQFFD